MYRESSDIDRSVLVVEINGNVLGFEPATGKILWEHRLGGYNEVEVLIREGLVYASIGNKVACYDYRTGALLRESKIPGKYPGRSRMLFSDGRLFVAMRGEVTCFDPDLAVLWHEGLEGRGIGSVFLGFPGNTRTSDG